MQKRYFDQLRSENNSAMIEIEMLTEKNSNLQIKVTTLEEEVRSLTLSLNDASTNLNGCTSAIMELEQGMSSVDQTCSSITGNGPEENVSSANYMDV